MALLGNILSSNPKSRLEPATYYMSYHENKLIISDVTYDVSHTYISRLQKL